MSHLAVERPRSRLVLVKTDRRPPDYFCLFDYYGKGFTKEEGHHAR